MSFSFTTPLINFLGFATGIGLYGVLLLVVIRQRNQTIWKNNAATGNSVDHLLLTTAVFGLLWNAGNILELVRRDFIGGEPTPFLTATIFTALGFLPATIVHSQWWSSENEANQTAKILIFSAYLLSTTAAFLHFYNLSNENLPSIFALQILTVGYSAILVILFLTARKQSFGHKSIWTAILAVFAVSALHLSHPHMENNSPFIEIIGHQASLPLAFAILFQDYRFAFADLFLKRALSFIFLIVFVSFTYILLVVPLFALHANHPQPDAQAISVMILFGTICGLIYPKLNQFSTWLVDQVILRRTSYPELQKEIMNKISMLEPIAKVLNEVKETLAVALESKTALITEIFPKPNEEGIHFPTVSVVERNATEIIIPTVATPQFKLVLSDFAGGRRLLSDEIEMLENIALQTARRIDALRVTHERCEHELREQEFSKLTTEAELRVLRAQINPHFLFNAMTTISYLIQTAPERANETLMKLTELLRGTLRSTGEFQSLGEELKLIRAYLEIEKARFEERLTVKIDVADEFLTFRLPSLILQPLVENAVKHGISTQKAGGTVSIKAHRKNNLLVLQVADTGIGIKAEELILKRKSRIGLNNVEQRLKLHYNGTANLTIEKINNGGTSVKIEFDLHEKLKSSTSASLPKRAAVERTSLINY